ncbi:hypothetical protein [Kordiimonas sp.]|uniref:hypothetical protein n=1 Tax=Kordiimonas sp. TaxID=1970157 RepID=UPI003A8D6064
MKYNVIYTKPSETAFCVGSVEADSQGDAVTAAGTEYGDSQVIAVSPANDRYVDFILMVLSQIWPQLSAWPMCGCDSIMLDTVVTIGRLLGKDCPADVAAKRNDEDRADGMNAIVSRLESDPKWQAKIGARLHGALVEDLREMVAKETEVN